jgi:hypothetical protein
MALGACGMWATSTTWLSSLLPQKAEAQAMVEDRMKKQQQRDKIE